MTFASKVPRAIQPAKNNSASVDFETCLEVMEYAIEGELVETLNLPDLDALDGLAFNFFYDEQRSDYVFIVHDRDRLLEQAQLFAKPQKTFTYKCGNNLSDKTLEALQPPFSSADHVFRARTPEDLIDGINAMVGEEYQIRNIALCGIGRVN